MDYMFENKEALAAFFRERASRCQKLRQYAKTRKADAALDVERATWINAAHLIEHAVFRVNHDTQGDVTSAPTSL
jgi:hypothetical protein